MSSRRIVVMAVATVLATGCGTKEEAGEKVLRILALNWPQAATEQRLADGVFTPLTGIKVVLETNRYEVVEQKMKQVINAKSAQYDIVHYDSQWLGGLVAAGGLERLDTPAYLGEPRCPLKFSDFLPAVSYILGKYPTDERDIFQGKFKPYAATPVYGLPWAVGCQILFYRKDLFEEAGIERPPRTWKEFVAIALKLNNPPDWYGAFTHAGRQGDYITQDFLPIMWSFGGELWDPAAGKVEGLLNSESNIDALNFYRSWNTTHGIVPSESANWGNEEVFNALAQEKVAMGQFWARFGAFLENPDTSRVVGKIAYAPVPGVRDQRTGTLRRVSMFGCQGTAITSFSTHKKEAWQYLKWLMSSGTQKALLDDPQSAFVSAREDLAAYTASRNPRNKVVLQSLKYARDFWNSPDYAELLSIIQRELNLAFIGSKSAQASLDTAAAEIQRVLDASPYQPTR